MRIVFAGTPEFAATALAALIEAAPAQGWTIPLVLTQPDRPAGRGMKLAALPVKALALAHGLAVATPETLSLKKGGDAAAQAHAQLRAAAPDVLVVAAYGLILPAVVLAIPRGLPDAGGGPLTAINIHASLLPRWRGAAPVARAIEAGDTETGTTIMQMEAGLDTGPMLLAEPLAIDPADTTVTLTAKLAAQGAGLIVAALRAAAAGELCATPQPEAGVTYAHKLAREEAWLDWTQPAARLVYQVRAFQPFPVACTRLRETDIKLHAARAEAAEPGAEPGMVLGADAGGVRISCGDGVLVATELQRAGGRRLPAREFLAGLPLMVGDRCSAPVRAPA
ncbi:MAG: methionyl-tRNA formyltransferase [Burkholderiales bacterium]|jgi:methionyl-tRNA formyltransferase|nr:methionyl-tRNA formyltransferase [Burkholderiales bacterium]